VPAISNLLSIGQRLRYGLTIAAAPIASDDGDRLMPSKPRSRRIQCSIRQQGDGLPPLQIADDRPIGLAPPESKIINADDGKFIVLISNTAANHPQQCVIAHWYHQTIGKGRRRSATERQTEMMNDDLQPLGAPTVTNQHATIELFAEDTPTAQNGIAPKPSRYDHQLNLPTAKGQVSGPAEISALNSSAPSTTDWARC
jgi:hypothetical protein